MAIPYFALKFIMFFGIVRSLVKYEALENHYIFLGVLYTACVAGLSLVFLPGWTPWMGYWPWVGLTFLASTIYFRLLIKFQDGIVFWLLIVAGIGIWLF